MFTPIHWTDRQSTGGRAGLLPRPLVDPHSGQPGFKATPARVRKLSVEWRGFLVTRQEPELISAAYATKIRDPQGWLVELAGSGDHELGSGKFRPAGEIGGAARRDRVGKCVDLAGAGGAVQKKKTETKRR